MTTSITIQTGEISPRTRFGVSIRKVFGADPRVRDHRANMFRSGVAPFQEPTIRVAARWVLGICGVLMLFSLPAASSSDDGGGVVWILLLAGGIAWAVHILMRKSEVILPAVSPHRFDGLLHVFRERSRDIALDGLSYDLDEDVYVKQHFDTFDVREIDEVISMSHGLALYPPTQAPTLLLLASDGRFRFSANFRHHLFANQRGLAYACVAWDFIDDHLRPDPGCPDHPDHVNPVARVVEMNQWTWRTIENLRIGEDGLVIQTIGGNEVPLNYSGAPGRKPHHGPGLYDYFYNTPAAQQRRQARRSHGGQVNTQPVNDPTEDPRFHRFVEEQIRVGKQAAITFVNTVNSLRNEWEDRQ
jgi:hypothetical protein